MLPIYAKVQLSHPGANYIRLLTLSSDLATETVECKLVLVELSRAPPYSTLSYTWNSPLIRSIRGAPDEPKEHDVKLEKVVTCDGHELLVHDNLFYALLQLGQPPYRGRHFWIDYICIDQNNSTERSHQVNLMAEIYRAAEQVVVWLGPRDEHIDQAAALIEKLCTLERPDLFFITPENLQDTGTRSLLQPDFYEKRYWLSLAQLFRRNWFGRAWVIQEVLFARELVVLCGGARALEWRQLEIVSDYLALSRWSPAFTDPEFLGYKEVLPYPGIPAKLRASKRDLQTRDAFLYTLIRARRHTCKEPVDKVFSLYGIAFAYPPTTDKTVRVPKADYNLTPQAAFTEATRYILESSDDLHVLAHVEGAAFRVLQGLPSWVPDWSYEGSIGLGITGHKRFWAAGRPEDPASPSRKLEFYPLTESPTIIRLAAARVARINAVGESKREVAAAIQSTGTALVSGSTLFPGWLAILKSLAPVYLTRQATPEVFGRVLLHDTDEHGNCPSDWKTGYAFQCWTKQFSQGRHIGDLTHGKKGNEAFAAWLEQFDHPGRLEDMTEDEIRSATKYDLCFNHSLSLRMFRTEEGVLGLGTESLREGDCVWIVPGSRVPLITRAIRTNEDGKQTYELVGAAYLHGYMHGEALSGLMGEASNGLTFQMIELE